MIPNASSNKQESNKAGDTSTSHLIGKNYDDLHRFDKGSQNKFSLSR
jgi:hypothetical protein